MEEEHFNEYVELIVFKSRNIKLEYYKICADVPVKDIKDIKKMKKIFGDYNWLYDNIKNIIRDLHLSNPERVTVTLSRKEKAEFGLSAFDMGYSYTKSAGYSCGGRYSVKNFTEKDYIEFIKKIGAYYEWYDNDGLLTANMKKKQQTLFSILF